MIKAWAMAMKWEDVKRKITLRRERRWSRSFSETELRKWQYKTKGSNNEEWVGCRDNYVWHLGEGTLQVRGIQLRLIRRQTETRQAGNCRQTPCTTDTSKQVAKWERSVTGDRKKVPGRQEGTVSVNKRRKFKRKAWSKISSWRY